MLPVPVHMLDALEPEPLHDLTGSHKLSRVNHAAHVGNPRPRAIIDSL